MTTPDLKALETLTRDYATFQARKSGLATALGGLLALLLFVAPAWMDFYEIRLGGHPLLELLLGVPFIWLLLKAALGRLLYRDLGPVKATPDGNYERRRWLWFHALALGLLLFQALLLLGFASGNLRGGVANSCRPAPFWVLGLPLCYLLPTPWMIRGIEEARAYTVLVGLCLLWLTSLLLFSFVPPNGPQLQVPGASLALPLLFLGSMLCVLAWAALALVRGWKEHRQYLALMRSLPREA